MNPALPSSTHPEQDPVDGRLPCSPHFTIRAAQLKDLPDLTDILAESFHSRKGLMRWVYPILRLGIYEDLRNRLRNTSPDYVCLVAVSSAVTVEAKTPDSAGELAGTVEMALKSTQGWQFCGTHPYLYLSNLAVRTECRRQGAAKRLLTACEQIALEWGFQDLYLHVLEDNYQARRLYLKVGYRLHRADPGWGSLLLGQPRRLFLRKRLTSTTSTPPP